MAASSSALTTGERGALSRALAGFVVVALAVPAPALAALAAAPAPGPSAMSSTTSAEAQAKVVAASGRVILLPRREGDPLPSSTDASLRESVRAGLRAAGVGVIEVGSLPAGTEVCDELRCLTGLRGSLGIGHVVRATLASIDRDYALRLELIDTADASVVATFDERCALCGLAEAGAHLSAGAEGLFRAAAAASASAAASAIGTLRLTSAPAPAGVTIDGVYAGESPIERGLAPGRHAVTVAAPGHQPVVQELTIVEGEAATIHLSLAPSPPPPPRWGGALLGVGIGLVAGGVFTLALDDRPRPLSCDPAAGACAEFETTWAGAALLAGGAVLTTLGAVMVRRARAHRRRGGP